MSAVCLPVHLHKSKTRQPSLADFLCMLPVAVAGSSSHSDCDMLCTSGFVNDVMFSYNGMGLIHHVYS